MKKIGWLLLGLLLLPGWQAEAELRVEKYRYWRSATAPRETAAGEFASLPLDSLIFGLARNPGAELRVAETGGREIPFRVVRRVRPTTMEKVRLAEGILNPLPTDGPEVESYEVEVPQRLTMVVSSLELAADRSGFLRSLTIESSPDRVNWRPLVSDQPFYREVARLGVERRRFDFEPTADRYFRVTLRKYTVPDAAPMLPLVLAQVPLSEQRSVIDRFLNGEVRLQQAWLGLRSREATVEPVLTRWPAYARQLPKEEGRTVLEIFSRGEPTTELQLKSSTPNYARKIRVFGSDDGKHFQELAGGVVYRMTSEQERSSHDTITFPEVRFPFYQVEIEDGAAEPLAELDISLRGPGYQILLAGPAPQRVMVYLAGPSHYPQYDIDAALLQLSPEGTSNTYTLAPQIGPNPSYRSHPRPGFVGFWLILLILLAGVTAGGVLWLRQRRKKGA